MALDTSRKGIVTFYLNVRFPTSFLRQGYELPVEEFLRQHDIGEIEGHGALFSEDQTEVLSADFSIAFKDKTAKALPEIIDILEEAGAPLGSEWSYDDNPDDRKSFGTLDALLVRFEGLTPENRTAFEQDLSAVIDEFHSTHADTAGFQGMWGTEKKATVSFHGFEYDDMVTWLDDILKRRATGYRWSFERTSPRYEDLYPLDS